VLFLDIEPHLRPRRNDPAMVAGLERLAFVPEILRARGRGRLSRAELNSFLERAASGERLGTLRAELAGPSQADQPRTADRPSSHAGDQVAGRGRPAVTAESVVAEPVVAEPAVIKPVVVKPVVAEPAVVAEPVVADPPALDLDRARIAKYLEQALSEERLDPGEHAARTLVVWSATTTRDLAEVVADLPLPADEPLRDRKPDPYADDLITPAQRRQVLDRLDRAIAGGVLTLWEYETRLDVAVKARTFQ
jgi:hypothetical protein